MPLRINDVEVIPAAPDFNENVALAEYRMLLRPKEDFAKWLVKAGYVKNAPSAPVEKRKPRQVVDKAQ
jgi:hypothetical protein